MMTNINRIIVASLLIIATAVNGSFIRAGVASHVMWVNGIAPAPHLARGENFWEGVYAFGEDGGRTAGGSAIYVYHTIRIYRTGDAWLAEIESNGFQTARQLTCDVKLDERRARLYFKSYGETNVFKPYTEGQLLLTLERARRNRRSVILTRWGAFQPAVNPLKSGQVYFRRERQ